MDATIERLTKHSALNGDAEAARRMVLATEENMRAVIDRFYERWGDVHGYIERELEFDEETIERVRSALVIDMRDGL